MPGSGGMWVNYLIWCVKHSQVISGAFEHFEFPNLLQRRPDYHSYVKFVEHTDTPDTANIVLGSDRAWMNFYLNLVKKKKLLDHSAWRHTETYIQRIRAQSHQFNLDWCDIWDQPQQFMQQLSVLTGYDLPYNNIAKLAMAQYSRTCVWLDPNDLTNNRHLLLPQHQRLVSSGIRSSYFYPAIKSDPQDNSNYCPLIFNGIYVEKVKDKQVKLAACCINHTSDAVTQVDFEHNIHLEQQRNLSRRGLPVPGCMHCYNATVNLQSNAIVSWHGKAVNPARPKLQKLDYNVDPICNAKCIQCSSYYSSAWAAEDQQHGVLTSRQFAQTRQRQPWQELDLSGLEKLYINGGEPLLSNEPLEILQHLDHMNLLGTLNLAFNTNGSVAPNAKLLALMKRCGSVVINFSIDGTEQAFEYIRHPLSWSTVVKNLCDLATVSTRFQLHVAYTLGIHNIDEVDNTMTWLDTLNQTLDRPVRFSTHLSSGPLDLTNAEPELKQVWLDRYDGSKGWHQLARNGLLNPTRPQSNTWQQHLDMIDQRRGLDWKISLPLLYQSWKLSLGRV